MYANLIPTPHFVRAGNLVLNLTEVRTVNLRRCGDALSASVTYRNGDCEGFVGMDAERLDAVFSVVRPADIHVLRNEEAQSLVKNSPDLCRCRRESLGITVDPFE